MGTSAYIRELWCKKQSDAMRYILRLRCWEYRQNHRMVKLARPSRPDKARRYGWMNKPGFVVYRIRIRRGGRKRNVRKGVCYGKPKSAGVNGLKCKRNDQAIAEARCGRALRSLRVLQSYWVAKDAMHKYFEVILVDPFCNAIRRCPRINWICKSVHKHREMRGLTSAGRKHRGLRRKGHLATKARPSRRAVWKKHNSVKLWRYR
eukprot:NODE_2522_length_776_cov_4010.778542_g1535_i1.p1 GENE.NODE_2522_length_776_cov_4010.778542_g1535_i1~~NODE_2522_length_776_cov_4010.778542_g1535_i1.p1  ORF type:complete len:219 (-),score=48.33 NODE_2522_length_776_cov_4010.778542_g1535_i1:119-733(-)